MVIIGDPFGITWIICHFNVPNTTIDLIPKSSCYLIFFVSVLDTVFVFVIIYITLIGYFMTIFLDDIEVWCRWPVAFGSSWILKTPESIIVGFLLEFIFIWLNPRPKSHIVSLMPCFCIYFNVRFLGENYEAIFINIVTNSFNSVL